MTNAEFYRHEIRGEYRNFCDEFIVPNVLKPAKIDCDAIKCAQCHMIKAVWLLEEHEEPEVDWSTVPIDTPVLVRDDNNSQWFKRHFAGLNKCGGITTWETGRTSFTTTNTCVWKYAKLWEGSEEQAEEERQKREAEE